QDRLRLAYGPLQRERAAVAQQHHHRLAGGGHGLGQRLLYRRQLDPHARLRLAAVTLWLAKRQYHHVGLARGGDRRVDAAIQRRLQAAAIHHLQRGALRQRCTDAGLQADVATAVAEQGPAAFDVVHVARERPDQGDACVATQREHPALVLQQHYR